MRGGAAQDEVENEIEIEDGRGRQFFALNDAFRTAPQSQSQALLQPRSKSRMQRTENPYRTKLSNR